MGVDGQKPGVGRNMTKQRAIPVVVPISLGYQCEQRVFPVLEARGINCGENGHSWLSTVLEREDLWAWTASLRVPKVGEVFDVNVPKYGLPKIHDVSVYLDDEIVMDITGVVLKVTFVEFWFWIK